MLKNTYIVKSEKGLISRASAALVSEANKYKCELFLLTNGEEANLKSIMNVMGLAVRKDAEITITAEGEDAEKALERIEVVLIDTRVI